jgi:hypothetical protein
MQFKTILLPLSLTFALAACPGSESADPAQLIQQGQYDAAIEAAEGQLLTVEAGSAEHKELVIVYAEALAESRADESRDAFLTFAKDHPDMVEPADFKYVVSGLRTHAAYVQAIDVMDAGKKRWAEDSTIDELVEALKQDIAKSGDADSMAKMKGLGYM